MKGKETPHYLHFVQTKMQQDESVLVFLDGWIGEMMGSGKDKMHHGCFILTRKRAVFCQKGVFGEVFQAIPLDKISSVETKTVMNYRTLTLHTTNDQLRFKTGEAAALFEQTYNQIEALRHLVAKAPVSPAPASAPDTPIDMLAKLGALRDAGVLTSDEFEAKKRDLLAKI